MSRPTEVLDLARQNALRALQQQHRISMTSNWLEQWLHILDRGVDDVAETLTSPVPLAVELRQNSPFAGVLPQDTRSQVLAAFAQHWREQHSSPHPVDVRRRTSTPNGE